MPDTQTATDVGQQRAMEPDQIAWFAARGKQGTVEFADHVRLVRTSPSIRGAIAATEYLRIMHRVSVDKSVVTSAVSNGELPALALGKAFMFTPTHLDQWLESRWINRP